MTIQIILLVLVLLIIWRVIDRWRRHEVRRSELWVWTIFWLIVGGLVIWPNASQFIADLVGIGRGVDLVVYLALVLIFYLLFRIFVRFERLDRNVTKIVRRIALDEAEESEDREGKSEG